MQNVDEEGPATRASKNMRLTQRHEALGFLSLVAAAVYQGLRRNKP